MSYSDCQPVCSCTFTDKDALLRTWLLKKIYWHIVDLQCYVNFYYIAKWIDYTYIHMYWGFPGVSDSKESACSAGDPGLIPGLGRSPGEGNGDPF